MTLEAVQFFGWRGGRLGFMPFFTRSADDLGEKLAGIGKGEYWCGRGIRVLNLGPRHGTSPTPSSRGAPPNTRLKLAAPVSKRPVHILSAGVLAFHL